MVESKNLLQFFSLSDVHCHHPCTLITFKYKEKVMISWIDKENKINQTNKTSNWLVHNGTLKILNILWKSTFHSKTACGCDNRGTVGSKKCDQQTGSCRCLRYVKGRTCSKCSVSIWFYSRSIFFYLFFIFKRISWSQIKNSIKSIR